VFEIWEILAVGGPVIIGLWLVATVGEVLTKRVRREWPEAKDAFRELFR